MGRGGRRRRGGGAHEAWHMLVAVPDVRWERGPSAAAVRRSRGRAETLYSSLLRAPLTRHPSPIRFLCRVNTLALPLSRSRSLARKTEYTSGRVLLMRRRWNS